MEPLQDQEIIADSIRAEALVKPPLTINHETSQIYSALRQCMKNNQELRKALVEATETIQQLKEQLNVTSS
jgi:DnaJ-domain-containing protein 1